MTRLASLGKNSIVYGLGQVLTRALSVLFLPLLTRYLTPKDYGAIGLLTILNAILMPLLSLGTTMSLGPVYFRSEDPVHRRAAIGSALGFSLVTGITLWLLGCLARVPLTRWFGREELAPLVPYALAIAAFSQPLSIVQLWLQFTERSRTSVMLTLVQTTATFIAALLLVVHLGLGARGMLLASAVAAGLTALLGAAYLSLNLRFAGSSALLRELLRSGAPLLGGMAANFVINNGPRLVLERVAGLTELGYFTLGAQLALPMDLAVSAFTTAWYPFFMSFQTKPNEAPPIFGRVLRLYIWGFGLVALLGFAFARAGVMLIAARDYEPAYLVIGLIATARVLWGVYNIVVPGLYFAGKLRYITVLQSMAALVAIGVTFAVARASPLLGCVLGIVSGNLALVLLQVAWNAWQGQRIVSTGQARAGVFTLIFCVFAVASLLPRKFRMIQEFGTAAGGALLLVTIVFAMMPKKEREDLISFLVTRLRKLRSTA